MSSYCLDKSSFSSSENEIGGEITQPVSILGGHRPPHHTVKSIPKSFHCHRHHIDDDDYNDDIDDGDDSDGDDDDSDDDDDDVVDDDDESYPEDREANSELAADPASGNYSNR